MNSAEPSKSAGSGAGRDHERTLETRGETAQLFEDSSFFANISSTTSLRPREYHTENTSALNVSALCCDEEISGFDRVTGRTWIYPTNYPVRDYQFNIINTAILNNTLVSLPTGLGKTFIAAVIMYNFYRWYPRGKIVFTAPTRPLVAQQINACYNIVAIPRPDTIEMTGHMQVATRKTHWKDKRVFFATPQVIYNDMKSGICPAERVRCLVFDEAHRARGNYAYCQIVSTLSEMGHHVYRVLALSATPGSKVEDVISVVRSLHIARLELRTESCIDVQRYSHTKKIETVVIPLGEELTQLRHQYVEILDTYARRLKQLNILTGNVGNLSKWRIVMLYKEFQTKERGARHPQHNYIMKDFTMLISLYHGLELLARHGSRVFLNFFDEHTEKQWMQTDDQLTALLERLRDDLGVNPLALDTSTMPDGTVREIPKDITFGHPKFDRLRAIMRKHFNDAKQHNKETKAIVFCEYRESVNLVHCLLLQCRPLIQPQMFVGQGASGKEGAVVVSQKAQLRVMRQFREGVCNVLVATCVAEEGLDVGSVDLIICFDISTRSPVRLVQRCGRTGRERKGQVYILVTEGREHQILKDCMRQRDNLNARILHSRDVQSALYTDNPRMLPPHLTPVCHKMHITVDNRQPERNKHSMGQQDVRSMFTTGAATRVSNVITREEFDKLFSAGLPRGDYFEEMEEAWACTVEEVKYRTRSPRAALQLSEWLEWQRTPQHTVRVQHSTDTNLLSELLQYADAKRFHLPPSTHHPTFNTQMLNTQTPLPPPEPKKKSAPTKKKAKLTPEPTRTDGDIRALFSTTKKSTKQYAKVVKDLGIDNAAGLPTLLIDLMVDLCVQDDETVAECKTCKLIDCSLLKVKKEMKELPVSMLKNTILPNIDLLDTIDFASIENAAQNYNELADNSSGAMFFDDFVISNIFPKEPTQERDHEIDEHKSASKVNCTSNFDLEFDFDFEGSDVEERKSCENNINTNNFDVGGLDDIFIDTNSMQSVTEHRDCDESLLADYQKENPKQALKFFGLDSVDDIFADSNDDDVDIIETSPTVNENKSFESPTYAADPIPKPIQEFRPQSPSLLAGTQLVNDTIVCSPVLGSQRNLEILSKKRSMSPVLCSQRNRISFNNSTSVNSPTPVINPNPDFNTLENVLNIDEDLIDRSEFQVKCIEKPQDNAIHKTSNYTTESKNLLTITQPTEFLIQSPSLLAGTQLVNDAIVCSPILCSQRNQDILNKKRSMSPVLCSQKNRISFNTYTSVKSSTPVIKSNPEVNTLDYVINIDEDSIDWSCVQNKCTEKPQDDAIHKTSNDTTGSKSSLTITQLIHMINKPTQSDQTSNATMNASLASTSKCNENSQSKSHGNRSTSPILFTQLDRNMNTSQQIHKLDYIKNKIIEKRKNEISSPILSQTSRSHSSSTKKNQSKTQDKSISIVVLDSDSNETINYDLTPEPKDIEPPSMHLHSPKANRDVSRVKRKLDLANDTFSSPYFNKRLKTSINSNKPSLSLKDKLKSIFSNDKINKNNDTQTFTATIENVDSQKENRSPNKPETLNGNLPNISNGSLFSRRISFDDLDFEFDCGFENTKPPPAPSQRSVSEKLHAFRRDLKKSKGIRSGITSQSILNKSRHTPINTDDSDSDYDFITKENFQKNNTKPDGPVLNYKVRKKKKPKGCDFLDLSAQLSDASGDSGDEMSDDSLAGSIVDFICDETHHDEVDMQAHYLRSVKSPVNGMFKIPKRPDRFTDVFSQPDRNDDDYEIDSFCVSADAGLTQARDISELELAERRLRRRRKLRKNELCPPPRSVTLDATTDSPVGKPRQVVRRLISSESGSEDD